MKKRIARREETYMTFINLEKVYDLEIKCGEF